MKTKLNMSKIHVCLQVRSSSNRLPYKCLLPINNTESIKILIKRIQSKSYTTNILTSNNNSDDLLFEKIKNEKINIYRGNLKNVYDRFIKFSKNLNKRDLIVRITGDNLFVDKHLIKEVVSFYKKNNYNYVSIDNKKSNLPYGISVEVFNLKTLNKWKAKSLFDKEHVTTKIIENEKNSGYFIKKNKFKLDRLSSSIDSIKDYLNVKVTFKKAKNIKLNYLELCKILNSISTKDINQERKKYSKIILGTAQFDGKYGVANNRKFRKIRLDQIFKVAEEIGINKLDTATNYIGVQNKIAKNKIGSKFKIISKANMNLEKNNSFVKQYNKTLKIFRGENISYFLIHDFYKQYKNSEKLIKFYNKNYFLKKKLGVSIYSPEELRYVNDKIFKIIQIPFNLCDHRWKKLILDKRLIIRSIFLQGIFFCKERYIPNKIKIEVKKIKKKLNYFVKKYKRINMLDLFLSYVLSFNFKGIIIGVDNEKQLKELFFYLNLPKLSKKQIYGIQKNIVPSSCVVDPRKWY